MVAFRVAMNKLFKHRQRERAAAGERERAERRERAAAAAERRWLSKRPREEATAEELRYLFMQQQVDRAHLSQAICDPIEDHSLSSGY